MGKQEKMFKRCPRCDNKCISSAEKCPDCGLIFSRLQYATNGAAKEKMRRGDREYILYVTELPKDLSYVKLLLFSLFLGLFGVHYYYTGKYVKGFLMSALFAYTIVLVMFNQYLVAHEFLMEILAIPVAILVLAWIVSVVYVLSRKFKVPVAIEVSKTGGFKA